MKNRTTLSIAISLVSFGLAGLAGCGGETPAPAPMPTPSSTAPVATATDTPTATTPPPVDPPPAPKPPLAESQKKTVNAMFAAFNGHDAKKLAALYTADCVVVVPAGEGMKSETGRDAIEKSHTKLFTDVPDVAMAAMRVLVKGDQVAVEWVATGTNTGGEKPTGKKAGFRAASIMWFDADGNIKQDHTYIDFGTIAMQQGKMPGKPRALATLPTADAQWFTATAADDAIADKAKATWPTSWPKLDRKAYDASITDDFVHEEIGSPNDFAGRKQAMAEFDMYAKAVPDMKVSVDNIWAAGGVVVMEFTFSGTQKGALGPIKATGKTFSLHGIDFDTMNGDRMSKATTYTNSIELLKQLGVIPEKKK